MQILLPVFTSLYSNLESGWLPPEVNRSDAGNAVAGSCAWGGSYNARFIQGNDEGKTEYI
jgi:hypothetical protein